MPLGARIPCLALAAAVTAAAACGPRPAPLALAPLADCLSRTGARVVDVSGNRDLHVSDGELALAFSTFDAYVGVARDAREARRAAADLDRDLRLLQQAGRVYVRQRAVFYFDAPIVPAAQGRLVGACVDAAQAR